VIIAAGPITNLIVAVLVFVGLLLLEGNPAHLPIVMALVWHSAAEAAGFLVGDPIFAIEGKQVALSMSCAPSCRPVPTRHLT